MGKLFSGRDGEGENGEELDNATTCRCKIINKAMEKVSQWVTIKASPNYLGTWMGHK